MNTSKPIVLVCANTSWNIFNFRKNLIKNFKNNGFLVYAVAPMDEYSTKVKDLVDLFIEIPIDSKGSSPFKDLILTYNFYKTYKRLKPNIVLHFTIKPNLYGTLACAMLNIPSINTVTGLGTVFLRQKFSSWIAKKLYRICFKFSNKIIFQNESDLKAFEQLHLSKPSQNKVINGSGVDEVYFQRTTPHQTNDPFVFMMPSRLLYEKGITEFIKAAQVILERHSNCQFKIVGAFEKSALHGYTEQSWLELKLPAEIIHVTHTQDMRREYEYTDVVVLPSYREGLSKALLEAASMECTIIASDVPGCREIVINEQTGWLCQVKSVNDLSDKMLKALNTEAPRRYYLGVQARKNVIENFTDSIIFKEYLNLVRATI
jgi:glycosyltransferase involved in cell wall biosynthesis